MKLKLKTKTIFLITLGFICALTTIIDNDLIFNTGNNNKNNFDKEYLKISKVSGKIYINGTTDWVDFKNAENCNGSGTYSDPYIIENLIIDAEGRRVVYGLKTLKYTLKLKIVLSIILGQIILMRESNCIMLKMDK